MEPEFGDTVRGNYASEYNPQRDGIYVETIVRNGIRTLNTGTWYRLTDRKGKFWEYLAHDTTVIKSCASFRAEISDATALAYNLDPDRTEPSEMGLCEQIAHLETHIRPTGTISGENVPPCPFCKNATADLTSFRRKLDREKLAKVMRDSNAFSVSLTALADAIIKYFEEGLR